MKYGFSGVNSSELIENYSNFNDEIIITFLDGSTYNIPLTQQNEKALLEKMLEQAKKRSESSTLKYTKYNRNFALSNMFLQGVCIILYSFLATKLTKSIKYILIGLSSLTVVLNGVRYKLNNDKIKELKKYDIYLSIRKDLENVNDSNLFNGVEKDDEPLNINTLDNYTLKDIKKIRDNLKKCQTYSPYFKNGDNNPTLIKKTSK